MFQLAPDDAWRCPHCKQLQQGRIKLSLWTLPDVLILHLKRFRQVSELPLTRPGVPTGLSGSRVSAGQEGDRRVKMQNMVRFPLMGMDMAPHVVKRSQSSWSLPSHWSPWRRPYGLGRNPNDYLYDLYAVCNHHGNMHGGHYTGNAGGRGNGDVEAEQGYTFWSCWCAAYCRNSIDGQWYCFDDSEVSPVADEDVCQQTAYILFYQRRTAVPSWSANSSVAGPSFSVLFCGLVLSGVPELSVCCRFHQLLPVRPLDQQVTGQPARQPGLGSLVQAHVAGVAGRIGGVSSGTR